MAYSGWYIPEQERDRLLNFFPTAYPDMLAHHVTYELGSYDSLEPPEPAKIEIIGFADDSFGVQALIVRVNGSTERPDGGTYHITWSIDRAEGRKPADSNKVIKELGWTPFVLETAVETKPRVFS